MHITALTLFGALGLAAYTVSAQAAPVAPASAPTQASNVVRVAGGCGFGFHRNRWGYCVPNRRAYYPPRPYPYGPGYSYYPGIGGDGYEPWNRPSPTDHIANQLNRQARSYGY